MQLKKKKKTTKITATTTILAVTLVVGTMTMGLLQLSPMLIQSAEASTTTEVL